MPVRPVSIRVPTFEPVDVIICATMFFGTPRTLVWIPTRQLIPSKAAPMDVSPADVVAMGKVAAACAALVRRKNVKSDKKRVFLLVFINRASFANFDYVLRNF